MHEKERTEFYQKRAKILKERMFRRIRKNPDDIIGTGKGEHYLGQTWCVRTKGGLCFLIDKRWDIRSEHYVCTTQILSEAREQGHIHPLFHPIPVREAPHRPYLVRQEIHGKTLDSTDIHDIAFTDLIGKILAVQLLQINISSSKKSLTGNLTDEFDLRPENFIVQDIDTSGCFPNVLELNGRPWEENIQFLDTLLAAGGKIWLFDYGSWLRPDGKGKNQ